MANRLKDPVTIEVIRNGLISFAREMKTTIVRTAYSTTVQEAQDFSVALFLGEEMVSQADGVAGHLGTMPYLVRQLLKRYPLDTLEDGDILITNDPYVGCAHTPDFTVFLIQRIDGLPFIPVARAHWSDVGGMSPGSISGKVTEIYQEGIRVPISHLYHAGKLNRALYDTILENVRLPEERAGDMRSQVAACRVAVMRLEEMVAHYSPDVVREAIDGILDATEERMRARIAGLPDGVYRFEDYLDSDGHTPEPKRVQVCIIIEGSTIKLDFAGSSPQATGPTNSALPSTISGSCVVLKALLDPEWPANQGFYRPIIVTAPEGTIVNARKPAATGSTHEVTSRVMDVVIGALAGVVPNAVAGANYGSVNHTYMGGIDSRTGQTYVWYEYPDGGMGATAARDGANATHTILGGDTKDFAIERLEAEYPLLCESYELRKDSGGAGRHRGGMGLVRQIRLLDDGSYQKVGLSSLWDRSRLPPFGLFSANSGYPQRIRVIRKKGGVDVVPVEMGTKTTLFPLQYEDVISLETGGGGGYGDPLERAPASVLTDVQDGFVSLAAAREIYGVVLDPQAQEVDLESTRRQRDVLRARRVHVTVVGSSAPAFEEERRIAYLLPELFCRLGMKEPGFVEVRGNWPAPLRLWAIADGSLIGGDLALDDVARRITRLEAGDPAIVVALQFTEME